MDEKKSTVDEKLENILGALSWVLLFIVILCVIFTTLNRNDVYKIRFFNNYLTLQMSIFMGLLVWGFRFLLNSKKYPGYKKYSIYAFGFAVIQLIFMLYNVY
jgi:hypothetical protein